MLCEICKIREANVQYTEIVNGVRTEHHFCSQCAKELDFGPYSAIFDGEFPFAEFLSALLGGEMPAQKQNRYQQVVCPTCGTTYGEFVKNSCFGCADCYSVFDVLIHDNIKQLQGSECHKGKKPRYQSADWAEGSGAPEDVETDDGAAAGMNADGGAAAGDSAAKGRNTDDIVAGRNADGGAAAGDGAAEGWKADGGTESMDADSGAAAGDSNVASMNVDGAAAAGNGVTGGGNADGGTAAAGNSPADGGKADSDTTSGSAIAQGTASAAEQIAALQRKLKDALRREEYETAAECRDRIRALKGGAQQNE